MIRGLLERAELVAEPGEFMQPAPLARLGIRGVAMLYIAAADGDHSVGGFDCVGGKSLRLDGG
jgi:hypothetical protein